MSISASTLTHKNKPLTRRIFNGRSVRFRTLFLILMTLILASFVRPTSVKAQAEDSGLEGTWLNDVKIVACAPAPPIVFARFQSMSTYMRGGTLIEGGSPPAPAVSRSAGHGIWERTGGHTFRVFFRFHTFDSLGRLVSIFEVTSNPSLVNGELSGPGTATITNLNPNDGTVINVIDVCNVATSRPVVFQD